MADSLRIERVLAQTRAHYRAAPAARERVRAALAARGEFGQRPAAQRAPDPGLNTSPFAGPRAVGIAKSTAAVLAGLSFVAGFWLGDWHANERAAQPPAVVRAAGASRAVPSPFGTPSATEAVLSPPPPAAAAPSQHIEQPTQPQNALPGADSSGAPVAATRAASRGPATRATHHTLRAAHPQPESNNELNAELVLLQRAERAIRSGEPDLALSFLDDLDRRYPETRLVEERTAARLMARCARHEPGAAEQAELFLRDRRRSVYSDRLRALCQLDTSPEAPDGNRNAGH